jgi:RimJ/RimL family protein N-acetyltransferase
MGKHLLGKGGFGVFYPRTPLSSLGVLRGCFLVRRLEEIRFIYSRELSLKDGTRVILRPLKNEDLEHLFGFFSRIPRADILIFKDDVGGLETIESWFTNPMYKKVFQLVALKNDEIIAKGTLNKEGLYWQHAAEIKLIVDPNYRGKGLGSQMFKSLLAEGLRHGFEKLIVRFTPDNKSFIRMLDHFGFKPEALLNCYVSYEDTEEHKDLVIASYNLEDWKGRFELYGMDLKSL